MQPPEYYAERYPSSPPEPVLKEHPIWDALCKAGAIVFEKVVAPILAFLIFFAVIAFLCYLVP